MSEKLSDPNEEVPKIFPPKNRYQKPYYMLENDINKNPKNKEKSNIYSLLNNLSDTFNDTLVDIPRFTNPHGFLKDEHSSCEKCLEEQTFTQIIRPIKTENNSSNNKNKKHKEYSKKNLFKKHFDKNNKKQNEDKIKQIEKSKSNIEDTLQDSQQNSISSYDKTQSQETTNTPAPTNTSLAKSSIIMFAGTFVSRILGLIRSALLLAVLGAFGAHDAFNIANTLPNTIFNLLAGGVLNAILVPQIVRALRKKNGDEFVNRLLTTAGAILLAITIIATMASTLLVSLFAYNMSAEWKALAVAFAFWCLPQIFFYGLYVLYGQVLNAKYSFGPYMWTPVLNNIVSILGLALFIYFFGFASPNTTEQISFWTYEKIALIAGTGTLGVITQALILIPLIKRTGFKLRIVWGIRGHGMKHASKMAMWAFGVVALSQFELLLTSNIASSAGAYGIETNQFIPSVTIHAFAYLIYIIPQSLVTTSIITALFTRLSNQAASGENEQMSKDYMFTSTVLGAISIFASLSMMVLSLPLATLVGPSRPINEIIAIAQVLTIMCLCIPFQAFVTINTRVLFAYEKTKQAFLFEIPRSIFLIFGALFVVFVLSPKYWVIGFCIVSFFAFVLVTLIHSFYLKRIFPIISYQHLVKNYLKEYSLMLIAASMGLTLSAFLFTSPVLFDNTFTRFSASLLQLGVISILMLSVYVLGLLFVRIPEINTCMEIFKEKFLNKILKK